MALPVWNAVAGQRNDWGWGSLTRLKNIICSSLSNYFLMGPQTLSPTPWGRTGRRRPSKPLARHQLLARKMGYRLMPGRLPMTLSWPLPLAGSIAPSNDNVAVFVSPLVRCYDLWLVEGPTQRTTHPWIAREMGYPPMRRSLCGNLPTPLLMAMGTRGGRDGSHGFKMCVVCCVVCRPRSIV